MNTKALFRIFRACLVGSLAVICCPDTAVGADIQWPVKFTSPDGGNANDLILTFSTALSVDPKDTTIKKNWPTLGPATSNSGSAVADSISADGTMATWNKGSFPGGMELSDGQKLQVFFMAPSLTAVVPSKSRYTRDGRELGNSVVALGQAPNVFFAFNALLQPVAFAEFVNPESFPVMYSNIQLFRNNDIANLNLDQFLTPTGQPVTGLPTSLTLLPGQSSVLPFGVIDPSGYELAIADAAALTSPGDLFRFGTADAVPEPAGLILLATGVVTLIGCSRHRRQARKAT
jgi:hypothetical protein